MHLPAIKLSRKGGILGGTTSIGGRKVRGHNFLRKYIWPNDGKRSSVGKPGNDIRKRRVIENRHEALRENFTLALAGVFRSTPCFLVLNHCWLTLTTSGRLGLIRRRRCRFLHGWLNICQGGRRFHEMGQSSSVGCHCIDLYNTTLCDEKTFEGLEKKKSARTWQQRHLLR